MASCFGATLANISQWRFARCLQGIGIGSMAPWCGFPTFAIRNGLAGAAVDVLNAKHRPEMSLR